MNPTKAITTTINPAMGTLRVSLAQQDPEQVLEFAHKAAKALTDVIAAKPKKVMIRGEQYLTFEDFQTLGRFYGVTAGIEWCKAATDERKAFGYEARAIAYHAGHIISAAEASCFRTESLWFDKPSFQIKSMAQTRAAAKALRNVLAWVVVLAGYKPCPAEEMIDYNKSSDSPAPFCQTLPEPNDADAENEYNEAQWREESAPHMISDKQRNFLRSLLVEKISDEDERERSLANLDTLRRSEACQMISELLSQPSSA